MLSRTSLDPKVLTADTKTYASTGNAHQLERSACLAALKSCSRARDVESGRQIHANARESGVDSDSHVASSLVAMYMKCGSVVEAQQAFDRIPRPDAVCWNALISGYAENGEAEVALQLFRSMQQCCGANPRTFAAALAACSTLAAAEEGRKVDGRMVKVFSLQRGMEVHRQAEAAMGIDAIHRNVYVGNALIDMYVKCRSMVRAQEVFDRMKTRDVVSWNVLMLGYAQSGENEELALEMFTKMVSSRGCQLDSWSVVAALKACSNLAAKEEARNAQEKLRFLVTGVAIHDTAERLGCDSNIFVANALLNMYANCGSMVDARRVFDKMQRWDVVSWNTIILGYAENDEGKMALQLFGDLLHSRCCVQDRLTLVAALKACCTLSTQEQGRQVDGIVRQDREAEFAGSRNGGTLAGIRARL
ncbi:pentatricopeptide repeat-containing protein At4g33170-like [Selaginella moellendorffii]|uniref:pentatricopeptide repeat-containing protein At4g33170-like n=1 Tax=Selaginella moellendorffii TaxID=88036 RepID=UPI000D1C847D|nr:pentatricopeptide repeat-containing protein At4g33170-like [Selaginella moellendorffii]|eukprot:XP_024541013.1 pentatricopeptide repeat-containing protein At4g33170-like [Selaginella moellendorffii]